MRRASVLIPTHEHAATLPFAVASVQAQGIDDLEILVVGDGVHEALRATVKRLQADDPRIKFFDFPKGPHHGEIHRDVVLRQARGRIVCYQADDDLWLPGHLKDLETVLETADFAGSMHVNVDPHGGARGYFFDLEKPEIKEPWMNWQAHSYGVWASNGFGMALAAHRLDAYLRLPEGWTTTPSGLPSDQFMWMKFVSQSWCRTKVLPWPVSLHFPGHDRRGWTDQQHFKERQRWAQLLAQPDATEHVYRALFRSFADTLLEQGVANVAALEREQSMLAHAQAERDALSQQHQAGIATLQSEQTARADVEAKCKALSQQYLAMAAALASERSVRATAEAERDALSQQYLMVAAALENERAVRAVVEVERDALSKQRVADAAALISEHAMRLGVETEREAMLASNSWRVTAPLRQWRSSAQKLRGGRC